MAKANRASEFNRRTQLNLILRSNETRVKNISEIMLIDIAENQIPNGIRYQIIIEGNFIIIERKVLQADCKPGALVSIRQCVALRDTGRVLGGNFKYIVKAIIGNRVVDSSQRAL